MTLREMIELVEMEVRAAVALQPLDVRATLKDATKVGASVAQRLSQCRREIVAHKETVVASPLAITGLRDRLQRDAPVNTQRCEGVPVR